LNHFAKPFSGNLNIGFSGLLRLLYERVQNVDGVSVACEIEDAVFVLGVNADLYDSGNND
jgi:hypothetical protein